MAHCTIQLGLEIVATRNGQHHKREMADKKDPQKQSLLQGSVTERKDIKFSSTD